MALGLTPAVLDRHATNPLKTIKEFEFQFTPDTSYPTGGTAGFSAYFQTALAASDAFTSANGMRILTVRPLRNCQGYSMEYDQANDKLLVYVSGGTQVANTTDLSVGGDWTVLVGGTNE